MFTALLLVLAGLVLAEAFVVHRIRADGSAGGAEAAAGTDGQTDAGPGTDAATEPAGAPASDAGEASDARPERARSKGRAKDGAKDRAKDGAKGGSDDGPGELDLTYVARVVTGDDGERIGESLSVADDHVIVKDPEGFLAVPLAQVAESGEGLVVSDLDWEAARARGGDWAKEHEDPLEFDGDGMPRS